MCPQQNHIKKEKKMKLFTWSKVWLLHLLTVSPSARGCPTPPLPGTWPLHHPAGPQTARTGGRCNSEQPVRIPAAAWNHSDTLDPEGRWTRPASSGRAGTEQTRTGPRSWAGPMAEESEFEKNTLLRLSWTRADLRHRPAAFLAQCCWKVNAQGLMTPWRNACVWVCACARASIYTEICVAALLTSKDVHAP